MRPSHSRRGHRLGDPPDIGMQPFTGEGRRLGGAADSSPGESVLVAQQVGRSIEAHQPVAERLDNLRDVVAAWRFQLPQGSPQAARLFAQIDDYLVLVTLKISGEPTEEDADELGIAYAHLKEEVLHEIAGIEQKEGQEDPPAEEEQLLTIEDMPAAQGEPSATQLWAGHERDTQDSDDAPLVEKQKPEGLSVEEEQPGDSSPEDSLLEDGLNGMTIDEVNQYLDDTSDVDDKAADDDADEDKEAGDDAANDSDDTIVMAPKQKKKKADGKGGKPKKKKSVAKAKGKAQAKAKGVAKAAQQMGPMDRFVVPTAGGGTSAKRVRLVNKSAGEFVE